MPFHLKGVAKIWFDSLQDTTQSSFRLLREAFIAKFKPQNNVDISVLSMSQSVEEYLSRFIDNVATNDLPENIQISIILPPLVALVMPQNPQSLEELRHGSCGAD